MTLQIVIIDRESDGFGRGEENEIVVKNNLGFSFGKITIS